MKGRILIKCQFSSKFKEYTLIGMRRMAQRIPTTHATNAHLVCAYADTTSRTLLPLPRAHPVFFLCVCNQSGQTWNFIHVYTNTYTLCTCPSSRMPPSLIWKRCTICLTHVVVSCSAIYENYISIQCIC